MRRDKILAAVFVLAGAAFGLGQKQTPQSAVKTPAAAETKRLLRIDLLQAKQASSAPPLRNIFAVRSGPIQPPEAAIPGRAQPVVDFEATDEPAAAQETALAPPVINIDLRYIGFIQSPHRLVALVNFEGRAIAVVQGDVIGEGVRIGKVNRQQVEVILPDSSTRTFSLEGE